MAKYLINTARTLIFSTALPPPAVAAAMAALELLREQPRRVEKLQRNARVLREALAGRGAAVPDGDTPIVPLIVGDADAARGRPASARSSAGVFAQAIRPPTVPDGHLAPAAGGDGLAHEVGAARGGAGCSRRGAGVRAQAAAARVAAEADAARAARIFDDLADAA